MSICQRLKLKLKLKHCNGIFFKCVNSIVELIFNEKVIEKCNLWDREQCTKVLFTVDLLTIAG